MKDQKNGLIKYSWIGGSDEITIPIYITRENIRTTTNQPLTDEEWYLIRDMIMYVWQFGMFDIIKEVLKNTIDGIVKDIED